MNDILHTEEAQYVIDDIGVAQFPVGDRPELFIPLEVRLAAAKASLSQFRVNRKI